MMIVTNQPTTAKNKIQRIEETGDLLADRGGLAPLMRYVDRTGVVDALAGKFSGLRQGVKGVPIHQVFRQMLAFLFDGTHRSLSSFDQLKQDPGYLAVLETPEDHAVSSHQVKRFFGKFSKVCDSRFRKVLLAGFAERLKREKPQAVELFLDTMVLNNDDANCRQGVGPTYKRVKGFQPLHLIWDGQFVDVQFRGGRKHGNHGLTAFNMVKRAVKKVREILGYEVPVWVRMDGGFFDGELFWRLDISGIGFICAGRMTSQIETMADGLPKSAYQLYDNGGNRTAYLEFGTRCLRWKEFYRAVFLQSTCEGDQLLFEFAGRRQVLVSNMGSSRGLFHYLPEEQRDALFSIEHIISQHHAKGWDELTHRGIKDFGFEQLPFKAYGSNAALYYLMVIGYNLMTWYKRDILTDLVGRNSYPTTVRRMALDFAAKIVRTGRQVIMKVTQAVMRRLDLNNLWLKCNEAEPIPW